MPNFNHCEEDVSLLMQLSQANRFAFNALYKKYWSFVFDNAYKRLQDVNLAEDVTQEVFTQLWYNAEKLQIKNLPNYLFIATRNRVIRLLEREKRYSLTPELLDHLMGMAESADARLLYVELTLAYEALVAKFSNQQQLIFRLKYMENLSSSEIAERLQLSPKTVRNQLGKINQKLRESLVVVQLLLLSFLELFFSF